MKIGFVIPLFEVPAYGKRVLRYTELREMALKAEKAEFDSIWICDHLLYRFENQGTEGIWECWTMLSALAEATQRIEFGTLVLCNPFRNPAIVAKMAHPIDEVSNGRFILGIGAGWNNPEFDAFGVPFDHRFDRFEEAIQIIQPLLKEGRVDLKGRYYQTRDCEIIPRGPRPKGPPLIVGGVGPRLTRVTAQYADLWNTNQHADLWNPPTELISKLHAFCAEVGRDLETIKVTALIALAYPDLVDPPDFMKIYITGSAEEVATAMCRYEEEVIAHLMIHISPYNTEGFTRLVEAMKCYRDKGV